MSEPEDVLQLSDKEQWQLQHGRPVPARITWALDYRGLEGPQVDERVGTFEGNPAGDVDDWEAARAIPRPEQVLLLARLTRFRVGWFYQPVQPGEQLGPMWVCWHGRGGCERVPADVVDDRGVLLRAGEEPADPAPAVQLGLFPSTQVTADPGKRAPRQPSRAPAKASPASRAASSRTPAPGVQPPALLPRSRMPDQVRAELMARLAQSQENRKSRRG